MDKITKIYIVLFFVLITGYMYFESTKKEPINWFPSYHANHKIPFGTFVLKKELTNLFPTTKVEEITLPPYEYLSDSTRYGTYFFVNDKLDFGDAEFLRLMKFVARGNDVFISTKGMDIDTLNIKTEKLVSKDFNPKVFFKFYNKVFKGTEFSFNRSLDNYVFTKVDTANTTALGITGFINENNVRTEEGLNFIKLNYGKGAFYMHTFPEVFTNYTILSDQNQQHSTNVLSYLNPEKPILWDSYYKNGKSSISSPMHYLLSSKYLKWAYYIALIGVLLFVVFEGKRKQRSIAILTPLKNQTIAFAQTIANMFYEKQDHKSIAEYKISYLLEFVRLKLHIPTTVIDETFYKYVASRSGNSLDDVQKLFNYCDMIHIKNQISVDELIELNKMIEKFKNTVHHGK